jgi:hypothetical protein
MAEYWQDKRINHKTVACAWGLVLVVIAMMVAITSFTADDCWQSRDVASASCAEDVVVREANADRHR